MLDVKALLTKMLNAIKVDYIVEQGTSGGSSYRKWNSGIAECWIYTTKNVSISGAYGSLYQGTWRWDFPITFISAPSVHCSHFKWGTSASWGTIAGSYTDHADLRAIDVASRNNATSSTISAYAIGRWK